MQDQLSVEDIEKMRRIVQNADAARQPVKTIDLNNPPREPYHFQIFPKIVYDHQNSSPGNIAFRTVRNHEELEEAMETGYSKEAPAFGNSLPDNLSPAYQAEADRVNEQIELRRRRGRPSKIA